MSIEHTTYLLGAGASALRMPIVAGMEKRFVSVYNILESHLKEKYLQKHHKPIPAHEILSEIKLYSEELTNIVANHFSIDTYARKLFLSQKHTELRRLKTFMSMFFTIEQLTQGNDPRYDAFFSSIIELQDGVPTFPDNISLVSWNYDLQVYHSIEATLGLDGPQATTKFIGDVIPREDYPDHYTKLNGIAGVSYQERGKVDFEESYPRFDFDLLQKNSDLLRDLASNIGQFWIDQIHHHNIKESLITFSWENSKYKKKQMEVAQRHFKKASSLVVIGYSFPTFNKRIDQMLLNSLPSKVKIYIQCHNDTNKVVERVQMMIPNYVTKDHRQEVIPVYDSDEFYIPHEFFT